MMNRLAGKDIPLYKTPPQGCINVETLESLINTRHSILHMIESKNQNEVQSGKTTIIKQALDKYETQIGWESNVENDIVSHFVLSLAFCKNEQDRIWFATMESKLFIIRTQLYGIDMDEIFHLLSIPLEKVENVTTEMMEKIMFKNKMERGTGVYRIPFSYALNLIASMHYFLHKGYVYVSKAEISQLVETYFKENLIKKMNQIMKSIDKILCDSRINHLVKQFQANREIETLSKQFANKISNDTISMSDIENSVEKSMPICMQMLHKALTSTGHLKHIGRMQYGLFLKGIGLSLDESMEFWKNKFLKSMPLDKFEKNYAYNIRHNYGKEGNRVNYTPYSCNKIQNLPPPSNTEYHGCPFKDFSDEKLRSLLIQYGMKDEHLFKILEKKRTKEYSVSQK
jgi:DNA primase large subunit